MNLILLADDDFESDTRCVLRDERRREHVGKILRAAVGDTVAVGRLGGRIGRGTLIDLDDRSVRLEVELTEEAPPGLGHRLAVALPRPPTLRKVLQQATAMGVKRFVFFGARRVEKSYWQSTGLAPDALRAQLVLGLEQARDTLLPEIEFARHFRPFVEDDLATDGRVLVADPHSARRLADARDSDVTLVIGPEGGFVPFELERFSAIGADRAGLGPRPLRVETAVIAALARLG